MNTRNPSNQQNQPPDKKAAFSPVRRRLLHLAVKMKVELIIIALACLAGLLVGAFASAFALALTAVTGFRAANGWILFLLPFAGLLIIFLYRAAGLAKDPGTNAVVSSLNEEGQHIPGQMSVLIFAATLLTHLCGGSAGREGAAVQMGGSLGNLIASVLKADAGTTRILIMCGMSAAFSAVFGTPMAATVFALEVASIGLMNYAALLPCAVASVIAVSIAGLLGISPEAFPLETAPALTWQGSFGVCLLAILCAGVSALFLIALHGTDRLYSRFLHNPYLKVFVGGCLIVILTLLVGNTDYNGSGVGLIERAVEGEAIVPWAFLLKILFTALTLEAGFKGGEIVPSLCIGATFGSFFGSLIGLAFGLEPAFCAAIGMSAVFCGVTNCPVTTLLIGFELFGFQGVPYFLLAIAVSYAFSGYRSLYSRQNFHFSKYRPVVLDHLSGEEAADDLEESGSGAFRF